MKWPSRRVLLRSTFYLTLLIALVLFTMWYLRPFAEVTATGSPTVSTYHERPMKGMTERG